MSNEIKKIDNNIQLALSDKELDKYLTSTLGEKKSQFVNNMLVLSSNSNELSKCDGKELIFAGIQATTLGLPLNKGLGMAYVLPYKNNKTGEVNAQFQIGFKGFKQLCMRSKEYSYINVTEVFDKTELKNKDFCRGLAYAKYDIELERQKKGLSKPILYYAYLETKDGFVIDDYMTIEKIEKHALKYSTSYQYDKKYNNKTSLWSKEFDIMAKKTVLKGLIANKAIISIDMQNAILLDQGVIKDKNGSKIEYIDNKNENEKENEEIKDVEYEIVETDKIVTKEKAFEEMKKMKLSGLFSDDDINRYSKEIKTIGWMYAYNNMKKDYGNKI